MCYVHLYNNTQVGFADPLKYMLVVHSQISSFTFGLFYIYSNSFPGGSELRPREEEIKRRATDRKQI